MGEGAGGAETFFELERLIALFSFAVATTWSPGPNNIMLANSGASFGYRASLPHAFGVALGFPLMLFFIALGLGEIFKASPIFRELLKWAGAALLLYIGWRIATAGRAKEGSARSRPFTFVEAAGFQWINPKAWSMAIGVASLYMLGQQPVVEAAAAAALFVLAGIGSSQTWTIFGAGIRRFLSTETRLRTFNLAMGLLVAGCVVLLFLD